MSAILAVVLYIVAAIVYFAGVGQVDSDDVAQVLRAVNDSQAAFLTSGPTSSTLTSTITPRRFRGT